MLRSSLTTSLLVTFALGLTFGCGHRDADKALDDSTDALSLVDETLGVPEPEDADASNLVESDVLAKSQEGLPQSEVQPAPTGTAESKQDAVTRFMAQEVAFEGVDVGSQAPQGALGGVDAGEGAKNVFSGLATRGAGASAVGAGSGAGRIAPPMSRSLSRHRAVLQSRQSTEQYTHYGVNGMTLVSEDALSTFAVDVDTASYTVARRKLQSQTLPPQSSVRVEEFVNYFPYSYDGPSPDEGPVAVHIEAAPNPFAEDTHVLRVGVKASELSDFDRVPVHLTFLVDVSGSMSAPDKLPLAKRSLRYMVDQLEPEDTIAIGTYAGRVGQVLEPTPVSNRALIHQALASLGAGGSTAMSSGIDMAYRMAQSSFVPNSENRVIVLSDGDANVGPASHDQILRQISEYAGQGITLTTVGFGMGNYKDTMMEQLANKGDGNYYYIDSFNEAKRVFGTNLAGTVQTVARDVKLQVEFNDEDVLSYRLIGYENRDVADRDFRNDKVDAGEIGSGHTVTALYEVVFRDGWSGSFGTVRVRAKAPGRDTAAEEWSTPMRAKHVSKAIERTSRDFRIATAAASFAELLRGSPHLQETTFAEVEALATGARRAQFVEDGELIELIATAGRLKGEDRVQLTTR